MAKISKTKAARKKASTAAAAEESAGAFQAKASTTESSPEPAKAITYAFPTKSRCPRCGSANTRCKATVNGMQYRECQAPVCRQDYKVMGQVV